MAVLATLLGGSTLGALIQANKGAVGVTVGAIYAVGAGIGFRYIRRATAGRNCADGACTVEPSTSRSA